MYKQLIIKFISLVLIIDLFANFSLAQNLTDVKLLHADLFNGYNKEIMPMLDHTKPLIVGIVLYIVSFNSFNEVDETISLTVAVQLNWTDPSLAWDPTYYGYLEYIVLDPSRLWLPPLFLVNKVNSAKPIGDDAKFYVTITARGEVLYSPGGILESKCPTDISKFPFDTQICNLTIIPWGITSLDLNFSSIRSKASLDYFTPHSDWTLQDSSTQTSTTSGFANSVFDVRLTIKRQPLYFVVTIVLPTLLFSLMNPLVFVLPVESGERVSLAMTILLSYAIFLNLVSSSIPKASNHMCVLLILMIFIIVNSGIIVIGTIVNSKYFYYGDGKRVGTALKGLVRVFRNKNDVVPVDDDKNQIVTGKDVSNVLDSIFFYGSYLIILIIIFAYFIYVLT